MSGDIIAAYRPIRQWREQILKSADELQVAQRIWLDAVQHLLATAIDGEVVEEPSGLSHLTYLLAAVCDIGPARIDPTPLTRCLGHIQRMRVLQRTKFGERLPAIEVCEPAVAGLDQSIADSIHVLNRMTGAWISVLEKGEPEEPIDSAERKIKPSAKTVGIIRAIQRGDADDDIVVDHNTSVPNVRVVRHRLENDGYEI